MSHPTSPPDDEITALLDDPDARAWFEQHRADLRRNAYGQGFLYWTLAATFVLGLVGYVAGYLLRSTAPAEPAGLLADMLYTFGFALWTAAVIVVLLEVIPDVKRRQVRRALEAYEATRGSGPRSDGGGIQQP
jgi:F0F1-type ATP synthase assembly protein I